MAREPKDPMPLPAPVEKPLESDGAVLRAKVEELEMQLMEKDDELNLMKLNLRNDGKRVREKREVINRPMDVEALMDGFYKNMRRPTGSLFTIDGPHQLGSWMKVLKG